MNTNLRVIEGGRSEEEIESEPLSPEERLRVFRRMAGSMMEDALGVWTEVYGQFEGQVTHGALVKAGAKKGFIPQCGWPGFLEKMWLLQHYLDHLKRICEGKA